MRVFDIDLRQPSIQFQQNFTKFASRDFVTWLEENIITRFQVIRRRPKLFYGKIKLASYLLNRQKEMVDVNFLARDIRHLTFLAHERQHRSASMVSDHFDYVADPISIESARRREHNAVTLSVLQLVT